MSRRRQLQRYRAYLATQPGLFDQTDEKQTSSLEALDDGCMEAEEKLRFMSFGSGSSGNCAYIGTPSCGLLIDGGVDNNYVMEQLAANGIDPMTIRGILLTHDHFDHVRYAYAILRRNTHMRLYTTPKAINGLLRRHNTSRRINDYHNAIYKEHPFQVGPFTVTAFEASHDGSDNMGFAIDFEDHHFVIVTDTGVITDRAVHYMNSANYLMVETDYDEAMLEAGPYTQMLKARIRGERGHLSNIDTASKLTEIAALGNLRRIFLCHLSEQNNTPELAYDTITRALVDASIDFNPAPQALAVDPRLHIAVLPRRTASPLTTLQ